MTWFVLVVLAASALALARWRTRRAQAVERLLASRLPLGSSGYVAGAEPIALVGDPECAAVLLHGFGDTPQTLAYLAERLHAAGWSVYVPVLPGHARTLREFGETRADAWLAFAREEFSRARARHRTVVLVGLSMGGALAAEIAADDAALPALVLLAPYLSVLPQVRRLARAHRLLSIATVYLFGRSERSILDPDERRRNLGFGYTTPRLLVELREVADRGREAAPRVLAPTLVVQSRNDHRISAADAETVFHLLGSREKRIVWVEESGHVVTVDYGRERTAEAVVAWLAQHSGARLVPVVSSR
jgi:carboxylesterase